MGNPAGASSMRKRAVYLLLVVLVILHQDFWLWDNAALVFGFLPAGLAYHSVYSLATAGVLYLALKYAWPADVEAFAEGCPEDPPPR
jgi:hypothetical protein